MSSSWGGDRDRLRSTWATILGVAYGLVLVYLGFGFAGMGHGTYIPLFVVAAPLSFLGALPSVAGAPALWGIAAFVAVRKSNWTLPVLTGILAFHYLSIPIVLDLLDEGRTYLNKTVREAPGMLTAMAALYLFGQAALLIALGTKTWRAVGQARGPRRR